MLKAYLRDLELLGSMRTSKKHESLWLKEYPFDLQLLTASPLYRESRRRYLELGGRFEPRASSLMRSLSSQDLFADTIDYSPTFTEMQWFAKNHHEVSDATDLVDALDQFNTISIFHEQNHRVIWRLLPPCPAEQDDVRRYLNFAESLVVMLDLAFGDEMGEKISMAGERQKIVYRVGHEKHLEKSKSEYRDDLLAIQYATYLILELVDPRDVLAAVNYVFPGRTKANRLAVKRALDINELFTRVTNPEWQRRNWKSVRKNLMKIQATKTDQPLFLPDDPLDVEDEFTITRRTLAAFGI